MFLCAYVFGCSNNAFYREVGKVAPRLMLKMESVIAYVCLCSMFSYV